MLKKERSTIFIFLNTPSCRYNIFRITTHMKNTIQTHHSQKYCYLTKYHKTIICWSLQRWNDNNQLIIRKSTIWGIHNKLYLSEMQWVKNCTPEKHDRVWYNKWLCYKNIYIILSPSLGLLFKLQYEKSDYYQYISDCLFFDKIESVNISAFINTYTSIVTLGSIPFLYQINDVVF